MPFDPSRLPEKSSDLPKFDPSRLKEAAPETITVPEYDPMGMPIGTTQVPAPTGYDPVGVGTKTAIMEPIYALGEFIPGEVGKVSARGAKQLEKEWEETARRYPVASRLGYYGTNLGALLAGGGVLQALKAPSVAAEALPVGQRLFQAAKTGGIGGAVYGVLQPTGEEDADKPGGKFGRKKSMQVLTGAALGSVLGPVSAGIPIAFKATKDTITRALGREATVAEKELVDKAQEAAKRGIDILSSQEKAKLSDLAKEEARVAAAEKVSARAETRELEAARGLAGTRAAEEFGEYGIVPQTKQQIGEYLRTQAKNYIEPVKNIRNQKANKEIAEARSSAANKELTEPFVNSSKMQELKAEIDKRLSIETDASLVKQLQDIENSLFVGTKTAKPSFESAETIRRKIGDAAFGVPEEGYAAIGQNVAKDLYRRLSDAMKTYEPKFEGYLNRYKNLSENIEVAGSKLGKALLGVEKEAPSYYAVSADKLPDRAFSSAESVRALVDAFGGNKQPVSAAAERWFANQLTGKTAQEARRVLTSDKIRSLMDELGPEFKARIQEKYLIGAAKQSERAVAANKEIQLANEKIKQINEQLKPIRRINKDLSDGIAAIENAVTADQRQQASAAVISKLKSQVAPNEYALLKKAVEDLQKANEQKTKARNILAKVGVPGTGAAFGVYEYLKR